MKKKILQLSLLMCMQGGILTAQTSQFSGFSDVTAVASFDGTASKNITKNHMEYGAIDLFITSQISERVSFLGEVAFEWDEVDPERLMINYSYNEYLNLSVGKFYTPLGYWNDAYNHGILLQPTIRRPQVLGSFIKTMNLKKQTGFHFKGNSITKFNLGYNVAITHGIASDAFSDTDEGKAVTINIHAEPVENFKLFLSGFYDRVSKGQDTKNTKIETKLNQRTPFQILNFSAAYMNGKLPFEFIGEIFHVTSILDSVKYYKTGITEYVGNKSTLGYVLYAGYKINKFTPYVTYDALTYQKGEKYFIKDDAQAFSVGIRYMFHPLAIVKWEYKYIDKELSRLERRIEMQFAIGF